MSETKKVDANPVPEGAPINLQAQFVKDFSFENPQPLKALIPSDKQPEINVDIQVSAEKLDQDTHEVTLKIKVDAKRDGAQMFLAELDYAGLVTLNVPENLQHQVLFISVPQLLFPYARQIVGDAVANGGFPPLMLSPVDFVYMYQQQFATDENSADSKAAIN